MAAARSVIVRFTSSSTSTAAPAAARLASLRQRVLQARSGVVKNHSNSDNSGARGRHCSLFRRRVGPPRPMSRPEHHARPTPPFAPTPLHRLQLRKRESARARPGSDGSNHHAAAAGPRLDHWRRRPRAPRRRGRTAGATPPCAQLEGPTPSQGRRRPHVPRVPRAAGPRGAPRPAAADAGAPRAPLASRDGRHAVGQAAAPVDDDQLRPHSRRRRATDDPLDSCC